MAVRGQAYSRAGAPLSAVAGLAGASAPRRAARPASEWRLPATRNYLATLLHLIERNDTDYDARYGYVLEALSTAHTLGFAAGFRIDPAEPEYPVAYIELPTGQVSWHMPQHLVPWDGHTTAEKYERARQWCTQTSGRA